MQIIFFYSYVVSFTAVAEAEENNQPYFKNQGSDTVAEKTIDIIDISHEFKDTSVSEVENEDSFQSEGTSSVIEVENLDVTKTEEKKNLVCK